MEAAKDHKLMSTSLIVIFSLSSLLFALGVNGATRDDLLVDPDSIWKTIVTDDGEIIDCVDIYKQPALRHPRLKNHIIQMKRSSYPIGFEPKSTFHLGNALNVNFQRWHRNRESCPEGSIPISRTSEKFFREKKMRRTRFSTSSSTNALTPSGYQTEYALAFLPRDKLHGALCDINVWNPKTMEKEASTAQVWITDDEADEIDTIEAGFKATNYTQHPIFFIYYTPDNYKTGCYNVACPGFVQTNKRIALGGLVDSTSTYAGKQFTMKVTLHRDDQDGNWWVNLQGFDVGYWPSSIFNGGLKAGTASLIEWGGMIVNSNPGGRHTSTEMGSGSFSDEGFGRAAYIKDLRFIQDGIHVFDARDVIGHATRPSCYDIHVKEWTTEMGVHMYYGGPGYSPACFNSSF